eukprot:TRINITY_DN243_c0_g2_i1.p1 TRINITY_DN243_c0_g2~~TRINITY_DN243_c0_g2_i1.p1  ORF type:complete len:446 (+),score=66.99 TRINITY_DN243_c0_g2_i1:246-1583(+)
MAALKMLPVSAAMRDIDVGVNTVGALETAVSRRRHGHSARPMLAAGVGRDLRAACQYGAATPAFEGAVLSSAGAVPPLRSSRVSHKCLTFKSGGEDSFWGSQLRRDPLNLLLLATGSVKGSSRSLSGLHVSNHAMKEMEEAIGEDRGNWLGPTAFQTDSSPFPVSLPRLPINRADDIKLHNPLQRRERMGCGWLGVVFEWEGVIVEDDAQLEQKAWSALAEEEQRPQPLAFVLKRAEGMKSEQVVSEVLCWSRDFLNVKRLAKRKEELYEEMQGGVYRVKDGAREFVESLSRYNVPVAVASTRPRMYLERAIEAVGMEEFFDVVLAAEDAYRGKPDPEMFQYAAEKLGLIAERCIVVGNSNKTVEAAHDGLMKCVAVVGRHPAFELGAADLVVRRLTDLSFVDLKNLSDLDSPEFQVPEEFQPEMEEEEEVVLPKLAFRDDDDRW